MWKYGTLISTCGGPYAAGNVTAWQCRSCECSFVVFRACNTQVSPYCAQRKCRENSLLGWSDLLIHSALLDLRLTVQLLPIKVETQKKRGNTERRRRRPLSYSPLMESGGTSPPHRGRKWEAPNQTSFTIPTQLRVWNVLGPALVPLILSNMEALTASNGLKSLHPLLWSKTKSLYSVRFVSAPWWL